MQRVGEYIPPPSHEEAFVSDMFSFLQVVLQNNTYLHDRSNGNTNSSSSSKCQPRGSRRSIILHQPSPHPPIMVGLENNHWGQGLVCRASKLQVNCEETENLPARLLTQLVLSKFLCSLLSPANGQLVFNLPGHVTTVYPLGKP